MKVIGYQIFNIVKISRDCRIALVLNSLSPRVYPYIIFQVEIRNSAGWHIKNRNFGWRMPVPVNKRKFNDALNVWLALWFSEILNVEDACRKIVQIVEEMAGQEITVKIPRIIKK